MRRITIAVLLLFPLFASAQIFDDVRVFATGGKSMTNWHGQADIQALNLELSHAFSRRLTAGFAVAAMNVWQPRSWFGDLYGDGNESVRALSTSLQVRRTWRTESRMPFYAELSTGPMWAHKRIPANTSHFNFISQGGAGVMLNTRSRYPIMLGYRFSHISNGGYSDRNPGLNISSVVVGVQLKSKHRR